MLAEVEPRLRKALPPGHVAFASLNSEKALLAQARGDRQSALALADESVAIVEAALKSGGQGADFMPTVLIKRAGIELDLQRLKESAADAARAIELLHARTPAGLHTSHLGRAYYALGRALEAQHERARARSAQQTAIENLEDAAGQDNPTARDARAALQRIDDSA
jgi:tetratricopeptide (TPR) repeat protein